jgi:hypothetical protein
VRTQAEVRPVRSRWVVVPLVTCCTLVTGCATGTEDAVTTVVSDFRQAVASGDGGTACTLLAEPAHQELEQSSGKPCESAVLEEVGDVSGTSGQRPSSAPWRRWGTVRTGSS